MSYRNLTDLRGSDPRHFYFTALRYAQQLWLEGHSGRAILATTRALYADVWENAIVLKNWPLPYRALAWIVAEHPSLEFPGNPRVSFQHQATRLRGERQALRRARAWAAWALVCKAKPGLLPDTAQAIHEPDIDIIRSGLEINGHSNEADIWEFALDNT